jgi:heme exporter protein CcmD
MFADKHAPYFIAAYAVAAAVLGWMLVDTWLRARRWRRRAEQLERERDKARESAKSERQP